jgi:pyruvate/2-oxoglutarate dehydrogenase complex dihydrolipoamide acyltransferase (E2) component
VRPEPLAPERRPTLYFLGRIRSFAPVFLDTDVDMTRVVRHRSAGKRYSYVSYVLHAAARALIRHPDANAAIHGRRWPRIARYDAVHGKLALDRTLNGRRVVLSAVLPDLDTADLDEIQRQVDHYRDGDAATMPEFAGVRLLHRLPWPLGPMALRSASAPLRRRPETMGTFALTSLGHRPVHSFHSVGGTTVTLGMGAVQERPVVADGRLGIAPIMRLSLAFDHRVIDGAEAADVLTDIKQGVEDFAAAPAPVGGQAPGDRS